MYEVNGLLSTSTSTLRLASSGTTCTPAIRVLSGLKTEDFGAHAAAAVKAMTAARTGTNLRTRIPATDDNFLFGDVEGNALPGLNGSDGHTKCDRVAVAGLNVGIGL